METKEQLKWRVVGNEQAIPNNYLMKWNEGMLKQCEAVVKHYFEWIDHPKLSRVRMFDSDYIEAASFTPLLFVPAIYFPWGLLDIELSDHYFSDFLSAGYAP
eukprot:715260_1